MNDAPDDRNLADVLNLEGLSRRRFLLGTLLSPSVLPPLGAAAAPTHQLAATEESLETENNWEGPFYKPGAPVRSGILEPGMLDMNRRSYVRMPGEADPSAGTPGG